MDRADHPLVEQALRDLRRHRLGYFRDARFVPFSEVTIRGGVLYCVEDGYRLPVSNILGKIHRRPRWLNYVYARPRGICVNDILVKDYAAKTYGLVFD
jgi:hypothetical protein